jgi:predicted RNA-binding Zn ribbon-like protein
VAWTSAGEYEFEYVGGRLCLDFVNTVGGMRPGKPVEHLHGYEGLVKWARGAGIASDAQARRLLAAAARDPEGAARALRRAVDLREAVFRVVDAASRGREPPEPDLDLLNRELGRALARQRLVRRGGALALDWADDGALEAPIRPVAKSAADLLASPDLARVHMCGESEADNCSWLFLDETRSGTRRWCTMEDCGNRAKQRRHYERVRRARGGA